MPPRKITVSVTSELTTDQRVIRISSTLQKMGFDVLVIGRRFARAMPLGNYSFRTKRIRCIFQKGFLQYAEFNTRLFFKLLFIKTDYLLANDLDTLVPNYVVSRWRRKKLFYDTHEYFTGVPELDASPLKKRVWKFFEDWIFPKLPVVFTVNDSIKKKYMLEYGNHISVIKNLPAIRHISPLQKPEQWMGKFILLMQGTAFNPGRGGMELMEAMQWLDERFYLVFIGGGTQWKAIAAKRKELKLEYRSSMLDKMNPELLSRYTPLATLGFTLDSFAHENFLNILPNKLFDYIQAHVPVVATATPEVKAIIEQYQCGICLSSQSPQEIAEKVTELMNNPVQYEYYRSNTVLAAKELTWEQEEKKIIAIFDPYR